MFLYRFFNLGYCYFTLLVSIFVQKILTLFICLNWLQDCQIAQSMSAQMLQAIAQKVQIGRLSKLQGDFGFI